VPDVNGIWINSKLMADQFAANGYLTVIIDIFNGDRPEFGKPGFDLQSWIAKGTDGNNPHTKEAIDPIIKTGLKWLREEKNITKVGAVGYCFGAKVISHPESIVLLTL
jgi:dienelactone hydrolase